ncbi:hypothetical protein [Lacinutrix salivirga]
MNKIALFIIVLISQLALAQTDYEKGMTKAFTLWETNKPMEAANLFERIANAEPDNWLPSYYAANVLIMDSFTKLKDAKALESQLIRAQDFINASKAISKNNPEIMTLQAILHSVYVISDGAKYGMILSGKIAKLYSQAYAIAPNNPRVLLNKTEWEVGTAIYFGQDTKPFCDAFEKTVELFANFKPESEFHPNWGKERAEQEVKKCKQ